MNLIVHEGRVGKADPAFPWPDKQDGPLIQGVQTLLYEEKLKQCLSHATWFDESDNERAVDLIRESQCKCRAESLDKSHCEKEYVCIAGPVWDGPYSVENFPEVEEVSNIIDPCPICNASAREQSQKGCPEITCYKGRPEYKRTVLRFKQEPNKAEVVADFGKEWYLRGLKDGMESVKQEPKEEPKTGESQEELWTAMMGLYSESNYKHVLERFTITRKQTEQ